MQKISGILPNKPRISSVDMNDGQVVRPGGPTFGRQVGSSSISKKESLESTAQLAQQKKEVLLNRREKDVREADIVKDLSDQFFMRRLNKESLQPSQENNLVQDPSSGEWVEKDFIPPGTFINLDA